MKKNILLFFLILILTGCNNEEIINETEYKYNRALYQFYRPYEIYASHNYVIDHVFNRYDLREVEMGLMRISTKYFANNKYYYQIGRHLNEDELKQLLSHDKLNSGEHFELSYIPKPIAYIHEQNYLNKKGELKGLSLALVLNPYQSYVVNNRRRKDVLDKEKLILFGKEKAKDLIAYIRTKEELRDVEIVIALFWQQDMSSLVPGSYIYEAFTKNNEINKFNQLNEKYYLLTDNDLRYIDINNYENFSKLEEQVEKSNDNTTVIGRGLYINNQLKELTIDINIDYITVGEINGLSQLVANQLQTLFNNNIIIEVIIKNESRVEAIITKNNNEDKSRIFFIN